MKRQFTTYHYYYYYEYCFSALKASNFLSALSHVAPAKCELSSERSVQSKLLNLPHVEYMAGVDSPLILTH